MPFSRFPFSDVAVKSFVVSSRLLSARICSERGSGASPNHTSPTFKFLKVDPPNALYRPISSSSTRDGADVRDGSQKLGFLLCRRPFASCRTLDGEQWRQRPAPMVGGGGAFFLDRLFTFYELK